MIEELWTHGQREIDIWKERLAGAFRDLDRSLQGHLLLEDRLLFRRVRR